MSLGILMSAEAQAALHGDRIIKSATAHHLKHRPKPCERSSMRQFLHGRTKHKRTIAIALIAYAAVTSLRHVALAGTAMAQAGEATVIGNPAERNVCSPVSVVHERTDSGVAAGDRVRVVVRSYETAAISAEINARITRLPDREGDRFAKGDILVEFDCRRLVAELAAARALVKGRQATFDMERQRFQYKSTGMLVVEQASAELEKATADAEGVDARRASCQIVAPFDGRVSEKIAQLHEIAQTNQPVIRIINDSKLELMLMVPSAWLARIHPGTSFSVKFDETGETHNARVLQSTGLIDPVSQSARVIAELADPRAAIGPGMSGTALFKFTEAPK
jgi:membrane fusion protein, multidrug efflux system